MYVDEHVCNVSDREKIANQIMYLHMCSTTDELFASATIADMNWQCPRYY